MSWKAPLVVLWTVLIAGTTVASENYRQCELKTRTELFRSDEDAAEHVHEVETLIVEEVSETN